ncbi:MAG: ATP-binding protein [Chitinispirillaceae bacterium]|nr:ATP-binding protein [Chitinispirillaceae bacterium]
MPINKTIHRPRYLERVKPFMGKDLIKVITGQRRVGKSVFLKQLADEFKKTWPENGLVFINLELPENFNLRYVNDFIDYVHKKSEGKKKTAVFIDEVQEIDQFELVVRGLNAEGRYDVYCTGSNADILSGELSTYLSGRYVDQTIHSLSYNEFLEFHQFEDSNTSFLRYIRQGGLPYLINLPADDAIVAEYLRSITETVLYRDVVARYGVRNIPFLERLTEFLAGTIGSQLSATAISKFLKSQHINMPANQVLVYLDHCVKAYLVVRIPRYDITGKRVFEIGEKYYFEDLGIRNSIAGFKHTDTGKLMENVVGNHLRICGYTVTTGCLGNLEIDFVATKKSEVLYVQVAYVIPDESTAQREFGNLLKIPDNYRKIVVSMDEIPFENYKGIRHLHIREFLLTDW